jgi:putative transcriptional regulator
MTIMHHPSDPTLAAFASGTLDEARAVVVAMHLSFCAQCRGAVAKFEAVGGALLDAAAPTAMSQGALERTLARAAAMDRTEALIKERPAVEAGLPAPLSHYALGSWRRLGGSVQFRSVDVASDDGVRVFMLRAAPGTRLLRHRHTGTEWTCVFEGAFRHEFDRYGPGDFDEADERHEHHPVVEEGATCICLVALQGTIKLQSWLGRLVQSLIRI